MKELGIWYRYGYGVEQNYEEALKWLHKSNNDERSCFEIALCYKYGYGVEQNYEEALNWYHKAKETGVDYNSEALYWDPIWQEGEEEEMDRNYWMMGTKHDVKLFAAAGHFYSVYNEDYYD